MKFSRLCWIPVLGALTACTSLVPYRNGDYALLDSCASTYKDYDSQILQGQTPTIDKDDACWRQSREKHEAYDALFVEFDDQGTTPGSEPPPAEVVELPERWSVPSEK